MKPEIILTNARIVTRTESFFGTVVIRSGLIVDAAEGRSQIAAAEDLDGEWLMPGLVEVHTDNLERHFEPRPGVVWPSPSAAVVGHDREVVGAGITTVLDAICVGEYRDAGTRRFILNESIETISVIGAAGLLCADHHLHLRCEIADPQVVEMFDPHVDHPLLRLVSLMDHTPGQRQWRDLARFRKFRRTQSWSDDQIGALVAEQLDHQARHAAVNRFALVDRCRARQIPMASHDDTTTEHVLEAVADGIRLSEFPTTVEAAADARRHGLGIVLGAPNLVRGGSHSGNVAVADLARRGLVDVISSDYVPYSLLHAACILYQRLEYPIATAIALISANPARCLGFEDRGEIGVGLRADLIRVRMVGECPVVRSVWVGGRRVL